MKIVIVEDEGITALFLQETISDFGHTVVGIFDNAEDTLECVQHQSVDLVFMDIQINGSIDGLQLAERIHAKYAHVGFIFLTSFKDSHTIRQALFVKPLGYIIKPVVESDIEAILMVSESQMSPERTIAPDTIYCNGYTYNIETKDLYYKDNYIVLSQKEQLCFDALIRYKNAHISVEQLIEMIWGDGHEHISSLRELTYRLRKKVPHIHINNIPNVGYILLCESSV
ncbi:response regulator [Sulfurovum sp.]|uniref:response regulator n=1 Tax=Sulfurovum sp. TaxID=1969726 RepID=UPI0025FB0704|nr:response regulator [Sulfurovum sp.]